MYVFLYFELMLWMVLWVVQLNLLYLALFSGANLLFRIGISSVILQLMIFTPRLVSVLSLSPASTYLAMEPITGLVLGLKHLARESNLALKSLNPRG